MPRRSRVDAPGAVQHVIARGNAGGEIVVDDADRRAFLLRLARVCAQFDWRVHAYCLMDTHVHLVLETLGPTLGSGMQRLLGGYAYAFNRRHGRFGHLFAGRFTSIVVEQDAHAIALAAYVVLNPFEPASTDDPRTGCGAATGPRRVWSGARTFWRRRSSQGCSTQTNAWHGSSTCASFARRRHVQDRGQAEA